MKKELKKFTIGVLGKEVEEMVTIIIFGILTGIALVLLICEIIAASVPLTIITILIWAVVIFAWSFIMNHYINLKRKKIFFDKIEKLDRTDPRYSVLFTFFDYVNEEENNIEVISEALEQIYFCPKKAIKHPEKVKRKELISLLIEYYLSLTNDRYKNNFFWDFNLNFFTWKVIGTTSIVGIIGISILLICYHTIPNPNDVLYTVFYFMFGACMVPLLAKFFGHFI